MDTMDIAQENQLGRNEALLRHRVRPPVTAAPPQPRDCADCDFPIPLARLAAVPYAECCVDCQADRERA